VTGATAPSFTGRVDLATGFSPFEVVMGDLDGDGRLDLAVADSGEAKVSILLNATAAGATAPSFAAKVDFTTGRNDRSVAIADLNGDGKLDLATTSGIDSTVSVLLGL
jgi:hypothetical protein